MLSLRLDQLLSFRLVVMERFIIEQNSPLKTIHLNPRFSGWNRFRQKALQIDNQHLYRE